MFDILDPRQREALAAMQCGENVFLTGNGGTGKSSVLKMFLDQSPKRTICLAPTGFAARNLPDAMTIHNFFRFPAANVLLTPAALNVPNEVITLLREVETIVIDEISMVRSDIFYGIDLVAKRCGDHSRPFGGKQIIVIGDFCQLPPVISDRVIGNALEEHFGGIYAFNAPAWQKANFHNIYLTQIHRQTDPEFIEFLNAIRTQKNGIVGLLKKYNRLLTNQEMRDELCLCSRQEEAEAINCAEMQKLYGPGIYFDGKISGIFPGSDLPTAQQLHIKYKAKMMVICNYKNQYMPGAQRYEYMNGEIGQIVNIFPQDKIITMGMLNGRGIAVTESRWSNYTYMPDKDEAGKAIVLSREIGRFWQFPLVPAWAISIHKAQGQTLDKMNLRLGQHRCFAPGQLYTALSRVRTSNDLSIDRPLHANDILLDRQVMDFYERTFPEEYS